jgi:putative PIN family toxin of toxin-antitoxin system
MLTVVLDTNVLVAAARSKNGASQRLLRLLPDERFQPAISVPLFAEYSAVLKRPEHLLGRSAEQADAFLNFLLSTAVLQEVYYLWRPMLPDPGDDMVLELAVAADCRYIVTHNTADFVGCARFGIQPLTPGLFLHLLRESA